jgi:hypothetical protein
MDIKEFVSESLKQIIEGVIEVQTYAKSRNAVVVPYSDRYKKVDFDIAVTVVEGKETGGKAGISVWSIGAGVTGKSESSSNTTSRIKFEIPLELPKGNEAPTGHSKPPYNNNVLGKGR